MLVCGVGCVLNNREALLLRDAGIEDDPLPYGTVMVIVSTPVPELVEPPVPVSEAEELTEVPGAVVELDAVTGEASDDDVEPGPRGAPELLKPPEGLEDPYGKD